MHKSLKENKEFPNKALANVGYKHRIKYIRPVVYNLLNDLQQKHFDTRTNIMKSLKLKYKV